MSIKQTAGRDSLGEFAPDFAHYNDDVLFGENWNNKDIVSYISSIEFIEMGAVMKGEIDAAKATFREVRDDIMDGTTGSDAAQKVAAVLEKIKAKYIDIYYEEHCSCASKRQTHGRTGNFSFV